MYGIEFPDVDVKKYSANIIAENLLAQVGPEGFHTNVLEAILDHNHDGTAVTMSGKYFKKKQGRRTQRKTIVGWALQIKWKNRTKQWVNLKDLKESNAVDVAEYVTARGIQDEPAFAWWVPYTFQKRYVIVSAVSSRVRKCSHKYGMEIPTSITHATQIYQNNGNTFWTDAILKEMKNVGTAFTILDLGKKAPSGWTKASGHLVFDVKMDFTRKARLVKDGHRSHNPNNSDYTGVVSRESVQMGLTYLELMDLEVMAADIHNAYLQMPSSEKYFIICGAEFGLEYVGKIPLSRVPCMVERSPEEIFGTICAIV